jgi:hypothetical protein
MRNPRILDSFWDSPSLSYLHQGHSVRVKSSVYFSHLCTQNKVRHNVVCNVRLGQVRVLSVYSKFEPSIQSSGILFQLADTSKKIYSFCNVEKQICYLYMFTRHMIMLPAHCISHICHYSRLWLNLWWRYSLYPKCFTHNELFWLRVGFLASRNRQIQGNEEFTMLHLHLASLSFSAG